MAGLQPGAWGIGDEGFRPRLGDRGEVDKPLLQSERRAAGAVHDWFNERGLSVGNRNGDLAVFVPEFEVERGDPIPDGRPSGAPLQSPPDRSGGCPSG